MIDDSSLKEASCLERLLVHKLIPDLMWYSYKRSIAQDTEKMAGSVSVWFSLEYSIFSRDRLEQKWGIAAISGMELPSSHLTVLIESKTQPCGWLFISHPETSFRQTKRRETLSALLPCVLKRIVFWSHQILSLEPWAKNCCFVELTPGGLFSRSL